MTNTTAPAAPVYDAYRESAQYHIDRGLNGTIADYGQGNAGVRVGINFATREEAAAFVAQFPKSQRVYASTCSGLNMVTKKSWETYTGNVDFSFTANGTTGAKNESAIKRFRAFEKTLAKLGLAVTWDAKAFGNAMSREALEPLLAL